MNDQPEAMVDLVESELKKRMLEDKEHANKKTSHGLESPMLKRKLAGKVEEAKTKGNKREKREIEEDKFKTRQITNKLASDNINKRECEISELKAAELKILNQSQFFSCKT